MNESMIHQSVRAWESWKQGAKTYHVDRFSADIQSFDEALEVLATRQRLGLTSGFSAPLNFIDVAGERFQREGDGAWTRVADL